MAAAGPLAPGGLAAKGGHDAAHLSPAGRPTSGAEPAPAVVTYDAAGVVRTTFGIRGSDAGLELADNKGIARTVLRVQPDGTPDLLLRDGAGRGRAGLSVLPTALPR